MSPLIRINQLTTNRIVNLIKIIVREWRNSISNLPLEQVCFKSCKIVRWKILALQNLKNIWKEILLALLRCLTRSQVRFLQKVLSIQSLLKITLFWTLEAYCVGNILISYTHTRFHYSTSSSFLCEKDLYYMPNEALSWDISRKNSW